MPTYLIAVIPRERLPVPQYLPRWVVVVVEEAVEVSLAALAPISVAQGISDPLRLTRLRVELASPRRDADA